LPKIRRRKISCQRRRKSRPRRLADHIQKLFETLLPASAERAYDIRLACRYAFALVRDAGQGADLVSALPVLLGPRLTIAAGEPMLAATEEFRANVVQAIDEWKGRNNPLTTNGIYIFSLAIFSHLDATSTGDNTKLPLLRVEDLRLRLEHIVQAERPVVLRL
jgi:DNA gyrase inhibitor GyrI